MKLPLKEEVREVGAQLMQRSHIPSRYFSADLKLISEDAPHRISVEKYVSNIIENTWKGYGLLLYGEWGVGKTAIAVCVGQEVLAHYGTVMFTPASLLVNHWIERPEERDKMLGVDLLILDDVGIADTEYNRRILETIVRQRSDSLRSTIITANSPGSGILGDGLKSVMTESMVAIKVAGKNWREDKREEVKKEILG